MAYPKLIDATYARNYQIKLQFDDGVIGVVDFENEIQEGIFIELKDLNYFKSFKLNKMFSTIEWKNGADFAPEFLYAEAKKQSHKRAA